MKNGNIFVSELSSTRHSFNRYHFCRGNSNKRKSRLGVILKGSGTYIYLNKRLSVSEGDVVFIPESIYCYSEWHGEPEIEVVYVSCFIHLDGFCYEPQTLRCDEGIREQILQISDLLSTDRQLEILEAYSLFYKLLQVVLPQMTPSTIAFDQTLQRAIQYITNNHDCKFSVTDLAKNCCVSESTLYHLFQRELGQTPVQFLNSIKINVAIEQLENTDHSIATICRSAGFASENHFRKVFAEFTGTTPLKYRKDH
ncbi:MAG: helix-turn-helix domain-containing protein [Ruminococcaceae bacterium]|nr:helix-turn-helix domain-containing protein [Oscillospiraceae bacterium]